MRFLAVLLLLLGAFVGYSYYHNPAACVQVANDFTPQGNSAHLVRDLKAMINSTTVATTSDLTSVFHPDATAPDAPAWTPPATLPQQPNWTWTTSTGLTYHDVKVVRVEADAVTIVHADGGGRIRISTLPPDLQKLFNYDPVAAGKSAAAFQAQEDRTKNEEAHEVATTQAMFDPNLSYADALSQAKAANKLLLLHFTGSDWCPYCKYLDQEVLNTSAFQNYSASKFVFVTLDFPRGFSLPESVKQQNESLSHKYNVTGFPTLLIADVDGKELGRTSGYTPGSGPNAVISDLQSFVKR
jgi:thioredoxin-related protein